MRSKIWIARVLALVLAFSSCEKDVTRVADITLDATSMNLIVEEEADLVATVSPADAENQKIIWSSEDVSIVEVNNGKVRALAPGTTNVVAKADDNPDIFAACKITVNYLAEKLTIESETGPVPESGTLTIKKDESIRLKASIQPEDSAVKKVTWVSANKDVVSISNPEAQEVEIKGVKTGEADITVTAAGVGLYATCHIVVIQNAKGLTIAPAAVELYEGETRPLTATVTPVDTSDPITWKSSDEEIAVFSDGKVHAKKAGTATITASVGSGENAFTATCPVTVKCHVKGVSLKDHSLTVKQGETKQLSATVYPDRASNKAVSWSIDKASASVASVSETGLLTAKASGTATITVTTTEGGFKDDCVVTVISDVTGLKLEPSRKDLRVGETFQLKAVVSPSDATNKDVTWTTSDSTVATVDDNGKVTAVAIGEAIICVTTKDGGSHAFCSVQVRSRVDKITLSPEEMTLLTTDTDASKRTLTAKITPADANVTLTWESDDGAVATVKASGKTCEVIPVGSGSTTIRVSAPDGDFATASVTVKQPYTEIVLDKPQLSLEEGATGKLTATLTPQTTPDDFIVWSSDPTDIATVDNNGNVTAIKVGTATITVASKLNPDAKATCTVTVKPVPVTSITLNKSSLTLNFGESETIIATVKPDNATNKKVTWDTSDSTIATVDANGKVTAMSKEGTATITAKSVGNSSLSATCKVTVTSPVVHVKKVSVSPTTLSMYPGESKALTATIDPSNAENKNVSWTFSDGAVATVNANGTVVAHSVGDATITVTTEDGGYTASCKVSVKEKPVNVTSITLDKSSFYLSFGDSETIKATIKPDNATNKKVTWTTSDPTVAKVEGGTVTAMSKAGTATITATSEDNRSLSATCTVKVVSSFVPVTGVKVEPSPLSIYLGQKKQLKATVEPANATDKSVVWSVQQGGVAAVDQNGVVTPLKEGVTRVFVETKDGGYSKSVQVTVNKNGVASIELPLEKLVLKAGETYDLTVTVKGKDASVPASNPNVMWKSSDQTIATVAPFAANADASKKTGRITALKAGKTKITVKSIDNSSVTKTCEVTVLAGGSSSGGNEGVDFDNWDF